MGRRGSKIDDNGMKWHHFLMKKLMVTSFLVKNMTFDQFVNIVTHFIPLKYLYWRTLVWGTL